MAVNPQNPSSKRHQLFWGGRPLHAVCEPRDNLDIALDVPLARVNTVNGWSEVVIVNRCLVSERNAKDWAHLWNNEVGVLNIELKAALFSPFSDVSIDVEKLPTVSSRLVNFTNPVSVCGLPSKVRLNYFFSVFFKPFCGIGFALLEIFWIGLHPLIVGRAACILWRSRLDSAGAAFRGVLGKDFFSVGVVPLDSLFLAAFSAMGCATVFTFCLPIEQLERLYLAAFGTLFDSHTHLLYR